MGGKKKKVKKPDYKKPKYAVPDAWDCPLCSQKGTFHVRIYKTKGIGEAQCRVCKQPKPPFTVTLTPLTQKVDVFLKFYDELVARDRAALEQLQVTVKPTEMMRKRGDGYGDSDDDYDSDLGMEVDNHQDEDF